MGKKEIIEQMHNVVQEDSSIKFEPQEDNADIVVESEWLNLLPILAIDEFVLPIKYKEQTYITCVKELDWYTTQNIEVASYRKRTLNEGKYYAGEYECREILSRSIIWVADIITKECVNNNSGDILSKLPEGLVDLIWAQYYPKVSLTAKEANALYSAAISYFSGDVEDKPIPPLVIEIDMLIKMGNLSRTEIRNIKTSEMQRIKLILKARSEALSLQNYGGIVDSPKNQNALMNQVLNLPPDIMPPGFQIPK